MKTRVDIEVNGEKIIDQLKSESSTLRELVGLKQNRLTGSSEGNENLLTQPTEEGGDPGIIKRSVLAEDIINQIKNSEISKINSDISRIESNLSVLETTDSEIKKNDLSSEINRAALEENSLRSSILEESTRAQTTENSLDDRTSVLEENFKIILGEVENTESNLSKSGLDNLSDRLERIEQGVYIWESHDSLVGVADKETFKITFTGLDKLAYVYEMTLSFSKSYYLEGGAWSVDWGRNLVFSINQTEIKWNFRTEASPEGLYGTLELNLFDNDRGSKTLELTFPEMAVF